MANWKVLVIMLFGIACLGLVIATIVVPLALAEDDYRWVWTAGLFLASIGISALFVLFLRSADRAYARDNRFRGRY